MRPFQHLQTTIREYVTHWAIAGVIITITGFAPDHWIAYLLVGIPAGFRHAFPSGIDYRLLVVCLGISVIVLDMFLCNRRRAQRSLEQGDRHAGARTDIAIGQSRTLDAVAQSSVEVSKPDGTHNLPLPDKPSIAVLPFANLSGDPEQDYFTDGVTEDIITELSRFHSLFVIARNSSFTYKGKAIDVRTVAKELGVRYVLEGSIRRSGDRIRVTGQLIDALTGNHIWAERYDRVVEDIFAVQEEVTRNIVTAIAPRIDAAERDHAQRRRPESLSAYEIAVRANGMAWDARRKQDRSILDDAIGKARAALAIDPRSTLALTALAFSQYQNVARWGADVEAARREGLAAATKAIEIDSSDSRAYPWKGMLLVYAREGDYWDEALSDVRRAHELNPNDVNVLHVLAACRT